MNSVMGRGEIDGVRDLSGALMDHMSYGAMSVFSELQQRSKKAL